MADWMTVAADIEPAFTGTWSDDVAARAEFWLTKAVARAQSAAACLRNPTALPEWAQESAKGIITNAVLRLLDGSKGGTQYQTAGPFSQSVDTKLRSDRILSRADRDELKQLCRAARGRRRGGTIRTPVGYR